MADVICDKCGGVKHTHLFVKGKCNQRGTGMCDYPRHCKCGVLG